MVYLLVFEDTNLQPPPETFSIFPGKSWSKHGWICEFPSWHRLHVCHYRPLKFIAAVLGSCHWTALQCSAVWLCVRHIEIRATWELRILQFQVCVVYQSLRDQNLLILRYTKVSKAIKNMIIHHYTTFWGDGYIHKSSELLVFNIPGRWSMAKVLRGSSWTCTLWSITAFPPAGQAPRLRIPDWKCRAFRGWNHPSQEQPGAQESGGRCQSILEGKEKETAKEKNSRE